MYVFMQSIVKGHVKRISYSCEFIKRNVDGKMYFMTL